MERAKFKPFPPHLDVAKLVETIDNFEFAERISCAAIDRHSPEEFQRLVLIHVVIYGLPLVIGGFQDRLDRNLFSKNWMCQSYGTKVEKARDLVSNEEKSFTIGHYLKNLPKLTQQFDSSNYTRPDRQRLYLKDIDCPPEWHEALRKLVPPELYYLNRSPESFNGPGSHASNQINHHTTQDGVPIAEAGDLMSCLPQDLRAENLMCYIGHEGTYTPAHQEMCASLGHNIMVEASDGSPENGELTRPGSAIWLMTSTQDRRVVSEYWTSILGHDIALENHFAQINAWEGAPFKTYVVEQRPGDLILVPPLAAHQVWNRGTRTMKVAWNRTTVDTLQLALSEAIPNARMVCRDEQYKNKAIIYYSLEQYSELLQQASQMEHPEVKQLWQAFEKLFVLFTQILLSESFPRTLPPEETIEFVKFDGSVTCSYCRCNIFNRFLTCPWCHNSEDGAYDVCMDCYVLGRSCACISNLKWVEQFHWGDLEDKYSKWRRQIISLNGADEKRKSRFPVLVAARSQLGHKTTAEICQEQLRLRPWTPPSSKKNALTPATSSDSEADRRGNKRQRTMRVGLQPGQFGSCHSCKKREPNWKMAKCSSCQTQYCYSILFLAFDIMPHVPMERPHWVCPRCLKICNCDGCRKDPTMNSHQPYYVLLGHNTRKIADPRSVESLVDLSRSNQKLLQHLGNDTTRRLEQRQQETENRRLQIWRDHQINMDSPGAGSSNGSPVKSPENASAIPVDPALELDGSLRTQGEGN